jgi:hypothetical protein
MTTIELNKRKIEFISNYNESDYAVLYKFFRLDEALETIRHHLLLSVRKMPITISIPNVSDLLCISDNSVLIDYKIRCIDNMFELLELSLEAYNRFERNLTTCEQSS